MSTRLLLTSEMCLIALDVPFRLATVVQAGIGSEVFDVVQWPRWVSRVMDPHLGIDPGSLRGQDVQIRIKIDDDMSQPVATTFGPILAAELVPGPGDDAYYGSQAETDEA